MFLDGMYLSHSKSPQEIFTPIEICETLGTLLLTTAGQATGGLLSLSQEAPRLAILGELESGFPQASCAVLERLRGSLEGILVSRQFCLSLMLDGNYGANKR